MKRTTTTPERKEQVMIHREDIQRTDDQLRLATRLGLYDTARRLTYRIVALESPALGAAAHRLLAREYTRLANVNVGDRSV